jgi:cytochrome c peroxidase
VAALAFVGSSPAQVALSPFEQLGSFLYFDEDLSEPSGQSCASCHHPDFGFVDPDAELPVSEGVIPGLFGGRNSPSSAYAMYAPVFYFDGTEALWIGGQFWDGRATGELLGDPLADQAIGPFLNPVEMANPDMLTVLRDVLDSDYAALFEQECGPVDLTSEHGIQAAYNCIGLAIGAFERTALFAPFSSQYDAYLAACVQAGGLMDECAMGTGKVAAKVGKSYFSKEEWRGFELFMGENNNDGILDKGEGAMCVACHVVDWTDDPGNVIVPAWSPDGSVPPMFTDFTFDNLGVPKNTAYPMDPDAPVDLGLGGIVMDPAENGKFKVMTLRNIGLTAPYGHNGLFTQLKDIVHFYNTRDVPGSLPRGMDWPMPEYPDTINTDELGNLGLSDDDEDALVEFMKTLDDGWTP